MNRKGPPTTNDFGYTRINSESLKSSGIFICHYHSVKELDLFNNQDGIFIVYRV